MEEGAGELFFEKKGAVDYGVSFFMPGENIELRKSNADEESGYYFEVKEALTPGKYVGWIGEYFWAFEITGSEPQVVGKTPGE